MMKLAARCRRLLHEVQAGNNKVQPGRGLGVARVKHLATAEEHAVNYNTDSLCFDFGSDTVVGAVT